MTEISPSSAHVDTTSAPIANTQELLRSLRRKEGNWVSWGEACGQLQKAGINPQAIFEETGFEPVQQNQVIVGSQVYNSIASGNISELAKTHFSQKGSDILYEFRILTQPERIAATNFAFEMKLDADEAKQLAKAIKDFSRLASPPEGFTSAPGDAVAYQCWKAARQQSELQERSRLIARGLKYAQSAKARQQIESLLTDFTVTRQRSAPRLPVHRIETEEELPRLIPVVGEMPVTVDDWKAVPILEEIGAFHLVAFSGVGAWVAVPRWQVVIKAEDPVGLLSRSDQLPTPLPGAPEEILIIVDRAQREWQDDSYFVAAVGEQLELSWFESVPNLPILGKVILILRPPKIFDEEMTKDGWSIDE